MTATSPLSDDPGLHLLALQIQAKRTEQAARKALGSALVGPGVLVPFFARVWNEAKAAERATHQAIRRSTRRVVIPMVRKVTT